MGLTLWFIGYFVILGGILASDDDEVKWYHLLSLIILWPLILGAVLDDIHEHCKKKIR